MKLANFAMDLQIPDPFEVCTTFSHQISFDTSWTSILALKFSLAHKDLASILHKRCRDDLPNNKLFK